MSSLQEIHSAVIAQLVEKYGQEEVDAVSALSPAVTMAVIDGQEVFGVTDEQREIILDFAELTVRHPKSNCTVEYARHTGVLN